MWVIEKTEVEDHAGHHIHIEPYDPDEQRKPDFFKLSFDFGIDALVAGSHGKCRKISPNRKKSMNQGIQI